MENEIQKIGKSNTSRIIEETLRSLVEGITGIAASNKSRLMLSLGHILQRIRSGNFLSQVLKEWSYFKEKGKIKDDYQYTEQHYNCLHEMLDSLEKDIPEDIRFQLLKKIFLVASTEQFSSRDSVLPQQYMKICRTLSSGAILLLITNYEISFEEGWKKDRKKYSSSTWIKQMQDRCILHNEELVEIYEEELEKKRLLLPRIYSDRSGVRIGDQFRLTKLGFEICEYLSNYEKIEKA